MAWKNSFLALGLAAALLPLSAARGADHRDGAATLADPSTDINDVYSFMSTDGSKVNLIMTVFPAADKTSSRFSDAAYYVFHTASRADFLSMDIKPVDIICSFDSAQTISCWVGDNTHFVSGNANNPTGISSADGKVKVYAGVRKDHFFFNLDGFNAVRTLVKSVHAGTAITFDPTTKCANLTPAQTTAVRTQLAAAPGGGAAQDFFRDLNTLAIVLEIDKAILTPGGPILSVWGATHKKM